MKIKKYSKIEHFSYFIMMDHLKFFMGRQENLTHGFTYKVLIFIRCIFQPGGFHRGKENNYTAE
jgi:hypothetical protein